MLHTIDRSSHPLALAATLLLVGSGIGLFAAACTSQPPGHASGSGYEAARRAESARGAELFATHCALCHGAGGAGNGPAAPLLFPPARDFGAGRFRLVSSENGVPTDADLAAVLRRGMPGSAMPAFAWMPDEDVAALVAHVRALSVNGLAERLAAPIASDMKPLDRDAALELAREGMTPSTTLEVPPPSEPTADGLARGREVYLRTCAVCHGEAGEGRSDEPRWNTDGNLNWARDFTAGVLKGGASHEALSRRIMLGMPGTSMLPTVLADPDDLPELVQYVQSLIPEGAEHRLVHRAATSSATRTADGLPTDGTDERWAAAQEIEVVLAPLAWHENSVVEARVAALHDGERIAVRVRWSDATRDDRVGGASREGDGVSIALTNAPAPPLIGMGSPEHPVNLWHWKAFFGEDVAGVLDVLSTPHRRSDPLSLFPSTLDAPLYLIPEGTTESLHAEGFNRIAPDHPIAASVAAHAQWSREEWSVVFTRPLQGRSDAERDLIEGAPFLFSLAVWNGSANDRHGRKSFSTWQRMELE